MGSGRFALTMVLAAVCGALTLGVARAASLLELNFGLSGPRYDRVLPACDDASALDLIAARFAQKEGQYWNSSLQIVGFDQVRETAFRPWAENTIPRRFCRGMATVSDGTRHRVFYAIGEDTGMIGATWGVEWCVDGYDRNWAYHPHCKMARP